MLRVFYGNDRVRAQGELKKVLGEDYEVLDGVDLKVNDLPSLLLGQSLLAEQRRILVRDLGENKEAWEKLPDYLGTQHEVVLWEGKLDKRTATYKALAKAGVEMREFKLPEQNTRQVFDILDVALRDGPRAVKMLREIEAVQDPYMLVGLMATQAVKKFDLRRDERNRRLLKELAKLDLDLKSSPLASEPWLLVEAFLLKIGQK